MVAWIAARIFAVAPARASHTPLTSFDGDPLRADRPDSGRPDPAQTPGLRLTAPGEACSAAPQGRVAPRLARLRRVAEHPAHWADSVAFGRATRTPISGLRLLGAAKRRQELRHSKESQAQAPPRRLRRPVATVGAASAEFG